MAWRKNSQQMRNKSHTVVCVHTWGPLIATVCLRSLTANLLIGANSLKGSTHMGLEGISFTMAASLTFGVWTVFHRLASTFRQSSP